MARPESKHIQKGNLFVRNTTLWENTMKKKSKLPHKEASFINVWLKKQKKVRMRTNY